MHGEIGEPDLGVFGFPVSATDDVTLLGERLCDLLRTFRCVDDDGRLRAPRGIFYERTVCAVLLKKGIDRIGFLVRFFADTLNALLQVRIAYLAEEIHAENIRRLGRLVLRLVPEE